MESLGTSVIIYPGAGVDVSPIVFPHTWTHDVRDFVYIDVLDAGQVIPPVKAALKSAMFGRVTVEAITAHRYYKFSFADGRFLHYFTNTDYKTLLGNGSRAPQQLLNLYQRAEFAFLQALDYSAGDRLCSWLAAMPCRKLVFATWLTIERYVAELNSRNVRQKIIPDISHECNEWQLSCDIGHVDWWVTLDGGAFVVDDEVDRPPPQQLTGLGSVLVYPWADLDVSPLVFPFDWTATVRDYVLIEEGIPMGSVDALAGRLKKVLSFSTYGPVQTAIHADVVTCTLADGRRLHCFFNVDAERIAAKTVNPALLGFLQSAQVAVHHAGDPRSWLNRMPALTTVYTSRPGAPSASLRTRVRVRNLASFEFVEQDDAEVEGGVKCEWVVAVPPVRMSVG